jgi:hypothetical protein
MTQLNHEDYHFVIFNFANETIIADAIAPFSGPFAVKRLSNRTRVWQGQKALANKCRDPCLNRVRQSSQSFVSGF